MQAAQAKLCSGKATRVTQKYYGINDKGSGNNSDAFRHAYWNALMARDISVDMAKRFADAHEAHPSAYFSKIFTCGYSGRSHTDMDLHNNQMGRSVMTSPLLSHEQLMDSVLYRIQTGQHKTIHADLECY